MARTWRLPAHGAALPPPETLGRQGATPGRSHRLCPLSCPTTGGRFGVLPGLGRRHGGAFSAGPPLGAPTFPTLAITLALG